MGKIAGSEIDGIQGHQEIDGILLIAEKVIVGIELGVGYFFNRQRGGIGGNAAVVDPDASGPIGNVAAASAYAVEYRVRIGLDLGHHT